MQHENGLARKPPIATRTHSWNGATDCSGPPTNCTGPDHKAGGGGIPHPHKSFPGNPGGYQLVLWNLVHKGFVVMAMDPIGQGERLEYPGNKAVEHGQAWVRGRLHEHA